MLDFIFDIVFDIVYYFYDRNIIKKITKKSLMGHEIDKTIEYYIYGIEVSPLDDRYVIKYIHNNNNYLLSAHRDDVKEAISYIKTLDVSKKEDCVYRSFKLHDGQVEDVTDTVRMFAGPACDFYKYTKFHVHPEFMMDFSKIIIVMNNLEVIAPTQDQAINVS
jgi:hypothetical protein